MSDGPESTRPARAERPIEEGGLLPVSDLLRDALVAVDLDSDQVIFWNPAATTVFGYSQPEALSLSLEDLIQHDDRARLRDCLEPFRAPGPLFDAVMTVELLGRRKSGAQVRLELVLTPFEDRVFGQRCVLGVFRNLAERSRRDEERLREARLEGVRLAVRTMEHHFGNDLAPVVGYLELLAHHSALPPELKRWVDEARQGASDAMNSLRRLGGLSDVEEIDYGRGDSPIIDLDRSVTGV